MPKAVFAGCARSCARFLDGVLANIEAIGSTYDAFEVVIVENDSEDDTRERLKAFAASRPHVRLIEADGLDQAHPRRGDRIAVARNIYAEALEDQRYADCDDLVVLDFDDVNSAPIDVEAFLAARSWLWAEPNRRGVFANSAPFYYDIWPLRHPTWCPDDCWGRVRKTQGRLGFDEAARRHVARLQIPISPTTPPIMVDSAFGGLGIYRKAATLGARYIGLTPDDEEVCDHVAFNAGVKGSDGVLAIYPALQNRTAVEHILGSVGRTKPFVLEQDGGKCTLLGPADHQLQAFRAIHPLYDRRLPALARIASDHSPDAAFIDIGANIGDSIALARLAGARMPAVAIEASLTYFKLLWANTKRSARLFSGVKLIWGYAGGDGDSGQVALGAGTAGPVGQAAPAKVESAPRVRLTAVVGDRPVSLVKTDTDGFDQEIVEAELDFLRDKAPMLWLEAQTMSSSDEAKWRTLLESMADQWTRIIIFDNFGFAVAAGKTNELSEHAIDLMAYARRQRERADYKPTIFYLDLALFPPRFEAAFEQFCTSLSELGD